MNSVNKKRLTEKKTVADDVGVREDKRSEREIEDNFIVMVICLLFCDPGLYLFKSEMLKNDVDVRRGTEREKEKDAK